MPEAPVRQQGFGRPVDPKPVLGRGENPGFFWIDREGTMREGGPDEARQNNGCWGAAEVQGLDGPLVCCPDDAMRELRQKQKLQCMQPGQNPRELTEGEMAGLQFKDGRPVADAAEDCKPFVCDQQCDQQNQTGQQPVVAGGLRERDRWAMDEGGEKKREKSVEEKEREKAIASRNQEIARQEKIGEEARKERDTARAERQKSEREHNQMGKSGQATPAGKEKEKGVAAAKEKEKTAQKNWEHVREWIYHLKGENNKDEARINELRKQRNAGMPKPDDSYDPKARARYCAMNPSQCPELHRYRNFGTGKGKGVDTWVVNPPPDGAGGGLPGEDPFEGTSQFLCIQEGGQGLGNNQGMNAGGNRDSFAGDSREGSQRGGCPGGARSEGVGFGGREGQEEAGIDVARRDDCNSGSRGPRLPGDDVINPGDPTFFECPEMGCPQQGPSSISLNNCPDNSFFGQRSRMSCHPYNGPAGAIDPVRE